MRWRGRRESSNIEDRRRAGGGLSGMRRGGPIRIPIGGRTGGGGLGTIIILVILFFGLRALGIDPLQMLDEGTGQQTVQQTGNDEERQFVAVVLADTEDVWHQVFQSEGATYQEPPLVLFSGQVQSACGFASAASGPFYCPGDRKVYLDLSFFNELARRFDAAGDFAQAYVIAHEVGHHVQNLTGVLPRFNRMRANLSQGEANAMSVRVELQADCYAGVWGYHTAQKGLLEQGDIEEALNAAFQIGDDTLQRRTQGYVVPESFNHGTSEQRSRWFRRGFESGNPADCDTFSGPI
ncbi:neutral zinc metallopeptidase [Chelativorans sp. AA-79]|uniref:KPN_02809 family neutral zinc metallopeptidase n=1 Tax=Chelativorans sp. AA-79 TaxID=3028735 RepID=UPI0023F77AD0|nr:neutral zinc metallopeptidase [Chelativorans sp. AA-79]WEX11221.1 zinc metallopeptidase [Chelativorans sp. AA-79]